MVMNARTKVALRKPLATFALGLVLFGACLVSSWPAGERPTAQAAPEAKRALAPVRSDKTAVNVLPDQYIVVFKAGTPRDTVLAAQAKVAQLKGSVGFSYWTALIGFSATLSPAALKEMRTLEGIDFIERDQRLTADTVQANPPRGLDRTSERLLPLDNRYTFSETGNGVHVYVVDRGIDMTHNEFTGRTLGASQSFVTDAHGVSDCPAPLATGVKGHGTLVAGIIGGATVGIAKEVTLHSVRVLDCTGSASSSATLAAAVDWITNNRQLPAVANISVGVGGSSVIDIAANAAVAAGVTVVVSAGNTRIDACGRSPARAANVIAVGATDPVNDNIWVNPNDSSLGSNHGSCVDIFAPGFNILSADNASPSATRLEQGTSFAAPHVAGVAALFLQNHTTASPAAVRAAIEAASNLQGTTANWGGVGNLPANTANRLLHWGSANNGFDDGDPHLTTIDGVHYDFQGAGEFVALTDGNGLEIQTRQTPIATAWPPVHNPHTGLTSCVSLNTAVAVRLGKRRVTYQPGITGTVNPAGLELRVDGVLTPLGAQGVDLSPAGRIVTPPDGNGIQIEFADGSKLVASPQPWAAEGRWYLNLSVFGTRAGQGLLGSIPAGSWLPALPDGKSLGALPAALHDRHVTLNQTFADAWRVNANSSLFDYGAGTSTATFTLAKWPPEKPPCDLPKTTPLKPESEAVAQQVCAKIQDPALKANCIYDVQVMGNVDFANGYTALEKLRATKPRKRALPTPTRVPAQKQKQ